MAIYLAMTLGTFACILSMRRDGQPVEEIGDLAGLARTKPAMAFFFAMLLFSLAGIPPLAGFFAKFYVFLAAIKAGLFALAVSRCGGQRGGRLLLSHHRQDHVFRRAGRGVRADAATRSRLVLAVSGLFNLLFFVYPGPLVAAATVAAQIAVLNDRTLARCWSWIPGRRRPGCGWWPTIMSSTRPMRRPCG